MATVAGSTELTSLEAGTRLNRHPSIVIRLAQQGRLKGRKRAGHWFFDAASVEDYASRAAQEKE